MKFETIHFQIEESVATVTLNRPEKLNAINQRMREELWNAVEEACGNSAISVIVFTGRGRAFSAGGDLQFFEKNWEETATFRREVALFTRTFDAIEAAEKPIIAAINGICTGAGLQLTLSCDLRIAAENAKFAFLENNIGLLPGAGGCSRLVKLVGYGKAKEMILLGETLSAKEAHEMGMVNRVVSDDLLEKETKRIARTLAEKSPEALGLSKRIMQTCVNVDLGTGRFLEFLGQSILVKTKEHKDGIRAFKERKKSKMKASDNHD